MIICARCDSEMPDRARFCPCCGEPAVGGQAATIPEAQPNICPQCGTGNPSVARFCKKDGFRLPTGGNDPSISSSAMPDYPPWVVPEMGSGMDDVSITVSAPGETRAQMTEVQEESILAGPDAEGKKRSLFLSCLILVLVAVGALSFGWYVFIRERPVVVPAAVQNKPAVVTQEKPAGPPVEQAPRPAEPSPPNTVASAPPPAPVKEDDPLELEKIINDELKAKGMGAVSVTITQNMTGIVKGQVKDEYRKTQALKIVAAHEGLRAVSEEIVVKPAKPPVTPAKAQLDLNRALKKAGVGSVTAQVNNNFGVTLKGTVENKQDRNKALSVARSFKDLKGIKDIIFVVAP